MKKLLLLMSALLVGGVVLAQESREKVMDKSFLAFHAGPSFPVDAYKSKTLNPDGFFGGGGFAKTGYTVNLRYEYRFTNNVAVSASAFFNGHKINIPAFVKELNRMYYDETGFDIDATGISMDHWKWYGITAGPALLYDFNKNFTAGFRLMGGVANANSPKVTYEGETVFGEDWSPAAVFRGGADLRLGFGRNVFAFINADYMYLKPEFKKEFTDPFTAETYIERGRQQFSVIDLTGGIGFRF